MNKIKLAILVSTLFYSCNGAEVIVMGVIERKIESNQIKIDSVNKIQEIYDKEAGRFDAKYAGGEKLFGKILNESNQSLENALIFFRKKDDKEWKSFRSDSSGGFEIVNIKPAVYDFIFLSAGYSQYNMKDFSVAAALDSKKEKLLIILKK